VVYKVFGLFTVGLVRKNKNRASHKGCHPKRSLTSVRQIAFVEITFTIKRATIRLKKFVVRYFNIELLQLGINIIFIVKNTSNKSVFQLKIMARIPSLTLTATRALVSLAVFERVDNITKVL